MTCKDCIHYQVCQDYDHRIMLNYNIAKKCKYFKDKSRIIEPTLNVVDEFKATERGNNGFGSTGR